MMKNYKHIVYKNKRDYAPHEPTLMIPEWDNYGASW